MLQNQNVINKIGLEDAWDITTGSSGVKVGVLDTGIDSTNPFLTNQIEHSLCRKFINGYEETVDQSMDYSGHGTMTAGIIAANDNGNVGMVGVAPGVKLVSLQIFDSNNVGNISYMISAIYYADSAHIPILNISGGYRDNGENDIVGLEYAIDDYYGLIISAAGNWGRNLDSNDPYIGTSFYPASSSLDNVISVGNCNIDDEKVDDSNYGNISVDLFAIGNSITSTWPQNLDEDGYRGSLWGTSVSAPFVTGVAALLLSYKSTLTAEHIKNIILTSIDEISNLDDYCVTGGRLNAKKALEKARLCVFSCVNENIFQHKRLCCCGYSYLENHIWRLEDTTSITPRYICRTCLATTLILPSEMNKIISKKEVDSI